MSEVTFFDRDLSWLSFNERVLKEAERNDLPLLEKIRFLSIYSSNLDEFYRVRMPALLALQRINPTDESIFGKATAVINRQLEEYGRIMNESIRPGLKDAGYNFLYNGEIPDHLLAEVTEYFFTQVAGFLQPVLLSKGVAFFPENNQLYLAVIVQRSKGDTSEQLYFVNCPCELLPRFMQIGSYIIFLEDIIKYSLRQLFPSYNINGAYNVKITRDAELDLEDEYDEDLAEKIEKQLSKRDMGFATRFLYEPGLPLRHLQRIVGIFDLEKASVVEGGKHHNLKDLASIPIKGEHISYPDWPAIHSPAEEKKNFLFERIAEKDRMIHAPYHSYNTILRFFNEASIDEKVEEIYTTMYRVASDSRIVQALISAAKNGKRVSVIVELKARFDEANNIRWAKKMKAAGVKIIYSDNLLKVHAKIALVIRKHKSMPYLGLLATGNLNENTARFYTDHVLLTAHQPMLKEMQLLFSFLNKRKRPDKDDGLLLDHLLVAQFNLQSKFLLLIEREIDHAKKGLPASFPASDAIYAEVDSVKEWKELLPKGEYEGLYGDESTGKVYVLCKNCKEDDNKDKITGYILQFTDKISLAGNFQLDVNAIKSFTGKVKRGFRPSALAKNPVTGEWFIVSAVNKLLVVADPQWKITGAYQLDGNRFNQPEGIAFDKSGNLYISNEGDDLSDGNILKFQRKK